MHIFYWQQLGDKGSGWIFGNGNTHGKSSSERCIFCRRREIKIILPVPVYAVGIPHAETCGIGPGYFILTYDYSMIGPLCEVVRRENMIVFHAKPTRTSLPFYGHYIMRPIHITFVVEHPGRR